jgi:hypothetical protein
VTSLPYPVSYDIDTPAEFNDERYEQALKALSPSDVHATVDELVAQMPNPHDHPLGAGARLTIWHHQERRQAPICE